MSSPQRHNTPVEVRERVACMCDHGDVCSSFAPRARAAPDPVTARGGDALRVVGRDRGVADAETGVDRRPTCRRARPIAVWSAAGAAESVAPGSPVALHGRYNVLAVGRERFNILRG